jgi:hypothetical protein
MAVAMSADHRGVVALSTPAMPESTVCSPMLNNTNGTVLQNNAATASLPHVARSRGNRCPASRASTSSTPAPSTQRNTVTWTGVSPFSASLIHRNPDPHSSASTPIRTTPSPCPGQHDRTSEMIWTYR